MKIKFKKIEEKTRRNETKERKAGKTKQKKSKVRQKNKADTKKKDGKEEYYEIETILAHKKKKEKSGKYDHLIKVKWKGYKKTEWYDEDTLREDVAKELDEYFNAKKKKKLMKDSNKRSTLKTRNPYIGVYMGQLYYFMVVLKKNSTQISTCHIGLNVFIWELIPI